MKAILQSALGKALERILEEHPGSPAPAAAAIQLDVPPASEMGDYSSDAALLAARQLGRPAVEVAQELADSLELPEIERIAVSRQGFLNFYLRPAWLREVVREIRRRRGDYGREAGPEPSVQIEFVSANPTGPLTVQHGRGAALGDALARVLEWTGCRVTREFYINDAGGGAPEPGAPDRDTILARQRETLRRFGVRFDEWRSEKELLQGGKLDEMLALLRGRGHVYETGGAVWLRSSALGDAEDRPLLRSNGRATYIAGDLAYHLDKFRRGFDRVIDIWGPEHEAYVQRTRAGVRALGCDPDALEILIFQPVSLRIDGILIEVGAYGGNNRLLDDVLQEVGRDAARFLYLARPAGQPLELDLDLAQEKVPENPIEAIDRVLRRTGELLESASGRLPDPEAELPPPEAPAERALMRRLSEFADEVRTAAREREPSRLTRYSLEVAGSMEEIDAAGADAPARLALLEAGRIVLCNSLGLLGLEQGTPV